MKISLENPKAEDVMRLLSEHLSEMASISPPESKHALSAEGLGDPNITFWTVRQDDQLSGCGALQEIDQSHGEIKSMRTDKEFLRRGVASMLLEHMISESEMRGYSRLSLETGSQIEFAPARALYQSFGFSFCEPFACYISDSNSIFMTRVL